MSKPNLLKAGGCVLLVVGLGAVSFNWWSWAWIGAAAAVFGVFWFARKAMLDEEI